MSQNETWDRFKLKYPPGSVIRCRVTRHERFGFFVDLGETFEGIVDITNLSDDRSMDEFPTRGSTVDAVVLGYRERIPQVALSTRASDFKQEFPICGDD